tara:strand:- start:316 stop:1173 length:858 start_codon:yes stop_codon:yes gene_type:complete
MSQLRKTVYENKYPSHIVLLGGLCGGISEIITTYPLDTIKTHLQIYPYKYNGIFHCGNQLVLNYGLRSLYKGMNASLAQVGGKAAIRFTVYDYINNLLTDNTGNLSNSKKLISGLLAGSIESIIWTAPTERIKILQQKNSNDKLNIYKIINKYGFKSLYKGTTPTIIKQSTSVGSRFWLYSILKDKFMDSNRNISSINTLLIGCVAGSFSTVLNHPFDVIKSNIQGNQTQKKMTIYTTGKELVQKHGILSLCNGLNARFIRTGIAQGVTFVVYEKFIFLYKTYKN